MARIADVNITPSVNGPYLVSGAVRLADVAGREVPHGEHVALCRCGHSKNKPFCDGMHVAIDFDGTLRSRRAMRHVIERRRLGPFSVARIGFGAMRLTGPNVFGPPPDRRKAIRVLQEAVERGVNHIDTAQFYGPNIVNELIREALHPYPRELILVSKVGARRDRSGAVLADDEPHQLRRAIEVNLRTLDVEALRVVNLRLMRNAEPDALFDEQLGAMISARDDGLINSIGLSNISRAHLLHALQATPIACVQNLFHVTNRASQPVLEECTRREIAFVPFGSLGFGVTGPDAVLRRREVLEQATRLGVTPAQLVLAWALELAPNMLVIPGASSVDHLRENLASSAVQLDQEAVDRLAAM